MIGKRWAGLVTAGLLVAAVGTPSCGAEMTLRLWTWDGPVGAQPVANALQQFEREHPGLKTKVESVTSDYKPKLMAALASGTGPDVFIMGDWDYAEFYRAGVLQQLDSLIAADKMDINMYIPPIVAQHRQPDGHFYTLPKDFSTMGIYYNKDFFDEAGLTYPDNNWTWQQALEMGQKLTKRDGSGKVIRWGIFTDPEWQAMTLAFAWGAGHRAMDERFQTFKGYLDNPEAMEAMQFYIDLAAKYNVGPNGWEARNAIGHQEGAFENGRVAILIYSNLPISRWRGNPKLNFGTLVPPIYTKTHTTFIMEAGWGMPANIKDPARRQAAWEMLRFLAGPQGQAYQVAAGWAMPSVTALAQESGVATDKYYANFFRAAFSSMPSYWAKVPTFGPVFADKFGDIIRDAMAGRQPLEVGIRALLPAAEANLQRQMALYLKK